MDDNDLSDLTPEIIVLSPEDYDRLVEILENPPPPSQALIDLLKSHKRLLKDH